MGIKVRFFMVFCLAIILIGGGLALLSNAHQHTPAHAALDLPDADLSVVGGPSLPAGTVDAIFARLGSPMAGTGALVEQTSRQTNIDDAFALAVWWTETNDGAAGVGLADRNPGSVRGSAGYPSAFDGYTIYPSYSAAVVYWFHMLNTIYAGRGLTTVYAISHPYVGTSTSYLWAGKVVALMQRYRGEAPPIPTVTPDPTIAPNMLAHHKRIVDPGVTRKIVAHPQSIGSGAALVAPAQQQSFALSATTTWLIALCALLLAFAIALCARLLPSGTVTGTSFATPTIYSVQHSSYPSMLQAPIFRLPSRSLHEPQTDALVVNRWAGRPQGASLHAGMTPPVPSSASVSSSETAPSLPTTGKLRPTRLMPPPPAYDEPEKVAVPTGGGRPTGLLARYGNTFQGNRPAPPPDARQGRPYMT
ncbi:MAG TPA: hypothetical protein VFQ36_09270 [Ktedonobacteraceae bacterium]|nr:hypothetical protein [Ktedonobacteraceae bacterium]